MGDSRKLYTALLFAAGGAGLLLGIYAHLPIWEVHYHIFLRGEGTLWEAVLQTADNGKRVGFFTACSWNGYNFCLVIISICLGAGLGVFCWWLHFRPRLNPHGEFHSSVESLPSVTQGRPRGVEPAGPVDAGPGVR
jgi:hypothetical protein